MEAMLANEQKEVKKLKEELMKAQMQLDAAVREKDVHLQAAIEARSELSHVKEMNQTISKDLFEIHDTLKENLVEKQELIALQNGLIMDLQEAANEAASQVLQLKYSLEICSSQYEWSLTVPNEATTRQATINALLRVKQDVAEAFQLTRLVQSSLQSTPQSDLLDSSSRKNLVMEVDWSDTMWNELATSMTPRLQPVYESFAQQAGDIVKTFKFGTPSAAVVEDDSPRDKTIHAAQGSSKTTSHTPKRTIVPKPMLENLMIPGITAIATQSRFWIEDEVRESAAIKKEKHLETRKKRDVERKKKEDKRR